MRVGFILPSLPNYSEIFNHNKNNGLLQHGFKVSQFVVREGDLKSIPVRINKTCNAHRTNSLFYGKIV